MEHRYAFILRIRQHTSVVPDHAGSPDPELGELHGTLQAFDSAQVQHFNSLHDLQALLRTHLSASAQGRDPSAASDGAPATG